MFIYYILNSGLGSRCEEIKGNYVLKILYFDGKYK